MPADAQSEVYWPAGKYGVVMVRDDGMPITLLVDRGGIVRIDYHMGGSPVPPGATIIDLKGDKP